MSHRSWFIYILADPVEPEAIRYVGVSCDLKARLRGHIKCSDSHQEGHTHKARWVRSVLAAGRRPEMRTVAEVFDEAEAYMLEVALIAKYRAGGHDLTNATDGGDGAANPSPETRAKMIKAAKGNTYGFKRGNTPIGGVGTRFKRGNTLQKGNTHRKGSYHTPETRARISEAMKGFHSTHEFKTGNPFAFKAAPDSFTLDNLPPPAISAGKEVVH